MKEKLTLTIERSAIARAKAFARKERISLSELTERIIDRLGMESAAEEGPRRLRRVEIKRGK